MAPYIDRRNARAGIPKGYGPPRRDATPPVPSGINQAPSGTLRPMSPWEQHLYTALLAFGVISAVSVFTTLFFITAPYGRHTRPGWGPTLDARLCWVLMEAGAVIFFAVFFLLGNGFHPGPTWVFVAMWMVHYVHRAFIYPFRLTGPPRRNPLSIATMAAVFNLYNTYINARPLGLASYDWSWFTDPRFVLGAALFATGFVINFAADTTLLRLRRENPAGYTIPHGGLYRFISCPNYFGEILEWTGWAIATWMAGPAVFAFWTTANLAPRAWANHRWYRKQFPDYPKDRKALIPWVW